MPWIIIWGIISGIIDIEQINTNQITEEQSFNINALITILPRKINAITDNTQGLIPFKKFIPYYKKKYIK
mgnify:CR=1 FL=1